MMNHRWYHIWFDCIWLNVYDSTYDLSGIWFYIWFVSIPYMVAIYDLNHMSNHIWFDFNHIWFVFKSYMVLKSYMIWHMIWRHVDIWFVFISYMVSYVIKLNDHMNTHIWSKMVRIWFETRVHIWFETCIWLPYMVWSTYDPIYGQ